MLKGIGYFGSIETTEELLKQTNSFAKTLIISTPISCFGLLLLNGTFNKTFLVLWFGAGFIVGLALKYNVFHFDRDRRKAIRRMEKAYLAALVVFCIGPPLAFLVFVARDHYVLAFIMLVLPLLFYAQQARAVGKAIARAKAST